MFCPECGTKNDDGAIFCASCGMNLQNAATPTATESAPVESPVQTPLQPEMQPFNYTQMAQQQPVQPQYNNTAVPKQPIKINPLMIVTMVEALVFVIAIVAFVLIGKSTYSHKKVAEAYFESLKAGDWKSAYEYLDVKESEFINQELFEQVHTQSDGMQISSSKIVSESSRKNSATVEMQYKIKDMKEAQYTTLELTKQSKKNFLFFDKWKVDASQYIVNDLYVYVPSGATLYLDGKKVPESMIESEDSYSTSYVIPQLFKGEHSFSIEVGDFVGAEETISVEEDNEFKSVSSLELTEKQQEEVIELAWENIQKITNGLAAGDDFSTIESIYSEETVEDAQDDYEDAEDDFSVDDDDGILELTFSDVSADVSYISVTNGKVCVEVRIEYDYESTYVDWLYETVETTSGSDYKTVKYVYEDGEWKLDTYSVLDYYWYY